LGAGSQGAGICEAGPPPGATERNGEIMENTGLKIILTIFEIK